MMEMIFFKLLENSVLICWPIIAAAAFCLLVRRAPKSVCRLLWLIVGLKLVIPAAIPSPVSLVPTASLQRADQMVGTLFSEKQAVSAVHPSRSGGMFSHIGDKILEERPAETEQYAFDMPESNTSPMEVEEMPDAPFWGAFFDKLLSVLSLQNASFSSAKIRMICYIWMSGVFAMLCYFAVSLMILRKKTRMAVCLRDNIWQCDLAHAPFIVGFIRPRIYIPFQMPQEDLHYVLAHEQSHIRHMDHCIKQLGFLILAFYWFHPLVWLWYVLMCRDLEFACDARVIAKFDEREKHAYAKSLLACSTSNYQTMTSLAFAEGKVKTRIRSVLNYRKPSVRWMLFSIIVCVVIVICFLTSPVTKKQPGDPPYDVTTESIAGDSAAAEFVEQWAQAFCGREGNYIADNCSNAVREELIAASLLMPAGDEGYSFGMSSPWPSFLEADDNYDVVEVTDDHAVILYYAVTSDPHVTVWRESLTFAETDDTYQVTEEVLTVLDQIDSAADFALAYPDHAFSKGMDYVQNGMADALVERVLQEMETQGRATLLSPADSALLRLNLADSAEIYAYRNDGDPYVWLMIRFADNSSVRVGMRNFKGQDIWIPETWDTQYDEAAVSYMDAVRSAEQFVAMLSLPDGCTAIKEDGSVNGWGMAEQMPFWRIESSRGKQLYDNSGEFDAWKSEGYITAVSFYDLAQMMSLPETDERETLLFDYVRDLSPTTGMNHCSSEEYNIIDETVSIWTMECDAYTAAEMEQYQIPEEYQTSRFWVIKVVNPTNQMVYFLHFHQNCYSLADIVEMQGRLQLAAKFKQLEKTL